MLMTLPLEKAKIKIKPKSQKVKNGRKVQRIKCKRCGHIIKKRTKGYLVRCSQCAAYILLKRFPDERKLRKRTGKVNLSKVKKKVKKDKKVQKSKIVDDVKNFYEDVKEKSEGSSLWGSHTETESLEASKEDCGDSCLVKDPEVPIA